ncbi:hypothetical protein ACQPZP_35815 [Spirillospora sp. CA-142024]|uniref:hypothetical protein n=1 Tax=Spirillospora sp. CA-142024 TaxID=3240036 RepID=UPI003D8F898E
MEIGEHADDLVVPQAPPVVLPDPPRGGRVHAPVVAGDRNGPDLRPLTYRT